MTNENNQVKKIFHCLSKDLNAQNLSQSASFWVPYDQILILLSNRLVNSHQILMQMSANPDWCTEVCDITFPIGDTSNQ